MILIDYMYQIIDLGLNAGIIQTTELDKYPTQEKEKIINDFFEAAKKLNVLTNEYYETYLTEDNS